MFGIWRPNMVAQHSVYVGEERVNIFLVYMDV